MTVKRILDEKGRQVVTIAPDMAVRDAAALLAEHRIGTVVVLDEQQAIAGLLAERDVVAAIARYGAECLDRRVSDVMCRDVHTCSEEMEIDAVMEIMNSRRARHLPVARNGRLVGIVSIGDAVRNHIRAIEHEAREIKAYIAG
ncbi:inosine-5-monophosphate dehydrogenase [Rhizobium sp. Leaf384]|uniref:CBS domain-containing protein n=1 Tax=unclassified Rhizobium TaxID=2613769 RepID=UPI000713C7FE|nr:MULTISPECIES: CBS domain-containing protein [unclassified Rhizobium]KQS74498.1 inosine-5-monophosphate dehydrogenase [Rhizobium sp. Leaf383]KQS80236.1 inosine-5-monophosphate dehydrogenase [Rhizobium sp. Leaf384]